MKRLIVNADDLGADEDRNAGIFEAIRAGSVTSVSILPNGPALDDALDRIRLLGRTEVSFGVHLNLSEGRPVSSGLRLLAGREGSFLGKNVTHVLLMNPGNEALQTEISREISAQVKVLLDAGVRIRHLDGHQHIHVFPAALAPAVEIAEANRIPWMRMPEEPVFESETDSLPERMADEARSFSQVARLARQRLKRTGIRTTDGFRGLYLKGRLSLSSLRDLLQRLPEGLTEFMVHPGRVHKGLPPGPFSGFSTPDREQELETLLDEDFPLALLNAGVILTSFPEAQN